MKNAKILKEVGNSMFPFIKVLPNGPPSVEFIYDFFSIPVSQIRIVCVATLGDINTGYHSCGNKFDF